jgi:hypothetical protein
MRTNYLAAITTMVLTVGLSPFVTRIQAQEPLFIGMPDPERNLLAKRTGNPVPPRPSRPGGSR